MPPSPTATTSIFAAASHRPATELVAIARLAEELGFDGLSMADHLYVPARPVVGYPYSADGAPPFGASTLWTDALVVAAAAAARTERLRFATGVYILPLRAPLIVARAVATLDALAPGRVQLGVGVGWLREEFAALGVDYHRRGALTDEAIGLLRKLWAGGRVEHDGPGYPFEPMIFEPHPSQPIPILVGGTSERALTRAATLGDGHIAMPAAPDELLATVAQLDELRAAAGRLDAPFSVHAWYLDAFSLDDHLRLVAAGVDTFYVPVIGSVAEARPGLERFIDEVAPALRAA